MVLLLEYHEPAWVAWRRAMERNGIRATLKRSAVKRNSKIGVALTKLAHWLFV